MSSTDHKYDEMLMWYVPAICESSLMMLSKTAGERKVKLRKWVFVFFSSAQIFAKSQQSEVSALLPFPEISTWDTSCPLSSLIVALYTATSFLENWGQNFRTQCLPKQATGVCFLWAAHLTQLAYVVLYVLFPLLRLQNEALGSSGWVSEG